MKGSATAAEGPLPIGAARRISNFFAREFRRMEVASDLPTTRELGSGSDFGVIEAHAGRFWQQQSIEPRPLFPGAVASPKLFENS
jgi:hypothetical protein